MTSPEDEGGDHPETVLPRRRHGHALIAVIAVVVLAAAGGGAFLIQRATSTKPEVQVSPVTLRQVTRFCTDAGEQVKNGTATPFMRWAMTQCRSEGASALAGRSPDVLGDLICEFAEKQVAGLTASAQDKVTAKLCENPSTPLPTGIVSVNEPPPNGWGIAASTAWNGYVGTNYVAVFAGTPSTESSILATPVLGTEGEVLLSESPQGSIPGVNKYLTRTSDGSLTIESASDGILHLTAADGSKFTFDVATHTLSGGQ